MPRVDICSPEVISCCIRISRWYLLQSVPRGDQVVSFRVIVSIRYLLLICYVCLIEVDVPHASVGSRLGVKAFLSLHIQSVSAARASQFPSLKDDHCIMKDKAYVKVHAPASKIFA